MTGLRVARGARIALTGESGSGKSTLLELLAMILKPDQAEDFSFQPQASGSAWQILPLWTQRNADQLAALRSQYLGYVLQNGGLLPYLSVLENIELPRQLLGLPDDDTAVMLAERLGIGEQLNKRPSELSVGQRQRAGIARALAHQPPVVIADEPTAAIDPLNAQRIMTLLGELATEMGVTLIVATHAHDLVKGADFRILRHETHATGPHAMTATLSDV